MQCTGLLVYFQALQCNAQVCSFIFRRYNALPCISHEKLCCKAPQPPAGLRKSARVRAAKQSCNIGFQNVVKTITQPLMQACASPRACALPRPTLQRQGLLWVWAGGNGALAALEAAATPPVLAAELDPDAEGMPTCASDGRKATMQRYYYRELCASIPACWTCMVMMTCVVNWRTMLTGCAAICRPYGWDTLVENLVDPSHLPFSHHAVLGNRCGRARRLQTACIQCIEQSIPQLPSCQLSAWPQCESGQPGVVCSSPIDHVHCR